MRGRNIKKIFNKFLVVFLITMGAFYLFSHFIGGAYKDLAKQLGVVDLRAAFGLWYLFIFGLKMPVNSAAFGVVALFLVNLLGTVVIFFTGFLTGLKRITPDDYSKYVFLWMGIFLLLEIMIPTGAIIFKFIVNNILGMGLFPYTWSELSGNLIEAICNVDLVRMIVLAAGISLFTIIKRRRSK